MSALERLIAAAYDRAADVELPEPLPAPRADFAAAIRGRDRLAVIAEFKRRSPSLGAIAPELDLPAQVQAYERAGAAAISVLTEPTEFGGSARDLRLAAHATQLPLLRKDFVVAGRQVEEAVALGASAVLLIARILSARRLRELARLAARLRLSPLVECHDRRDLELALAIPDALLGINNRDLGTLRIDLGTVERLLPYVPRDRVVVAESGYEEPEQLRLLAGRVDAVLIGSALMRADDPAGFLAEALR